MKFFIILTLVVVHTKAISCICSDYSHPIQTVVFTPYSFEGKIVDTTIVDTNGSRMIKAVFNVNNWMSPNSGADTISVYTLESSCMLNFSVGQSWLIFARFYGDKLTSNQCDHSFLLDDNEWGQAILKSVDNLTTGSHDIDIDIPALYGTYRLTGRMKDGEPVGRWTKVRGIDTLAFYNFKNGNLDGMQMETNEESLPPLQHYFKIERNDTTITLIQYNHNMKLESHCVYHNGPARFRNQSPVEGQAGLHAHFFDSYRQIKCDDL